MTDKILLVDDEERVLKGIQRGLHGRYDMVTADGGQNGLAILEKHNDVAVVMSDMRMPQMDGAQFLRHVRERYPHIVRLMLTGNNDQETAKKAVNEGAVFRFLNKPCTRESLTEAIDAALEQFQLQRAEQDVLKRTLGECVTAMSSIMALARPEHFGAVDRVANLAVRLTRKMTGSENWAIHAAATLSKLGYLSTNIQLVERRDAGEDMSAAEQQELTEHAAVGADLLARIPRMEAVAEIIRYHEYRYDGKNATAEKRQRADLPFGARLLRVVQYYDILSDNGWSASAALGKLRGAAGDFDNTIVDALSELLEADSSGEAVTKRVSAQQLTTRMVIQEDVETTDGVLIVRKGQVVNAAVAKRLQAMEERGVLSMQPLVSEAGPDDGTAAPGAAVSDNAA